jgi:hypothetical protein
MVKSYWGITGKLLMIGMLIFAVITTLVGLLSRNPFRIDFSFYAVLFIFSAYFAFAFVCLVIGKYGDIKLKRLKKIGRAFEPIKVTALPGSMAPHSFTKETYASFRVKCVLRDNQNNEVTIKSRRLTICDGPLRIVLQSSQILCEATVYFHPRKPYVYAVEVWV